MRFVAHVCAYVPLLGIQQSYAERTRPASLDCSGEIISVGKHAPNLYLNPGALPSHAHLFSVQLLIADRPFSLFSPSCGLEKECGFLILITMVSDSILVWVYIHTVLRYHVGR